MHVHFQQNVGNYTNKVCIAAPLTNPIYSTLNMSNSRFYGSQRICHCKFTVVMCMNSDRLIYIFHYFMDSFIDLKGKGAAICIAKCNYISSRSEEHTSELQSLRHLVCRLLLEKKTKIKKRSQTSTHALHGPDDVTDTASS